MFNFTQIFRVGARRRGGHRGGSYRIIEQSNVHDPLGLRDRAILETLYSTGMRRLEMANLKLWDLDLERSTVTIRQGKGKDRIVPIGDRAAGVGAQVSRRGAAEAGGRARRPGGLPVECRRAFLARLPHRDGAQLRGDLGGCGKQGACHLFRHTMATLMLEGGADIPFIQAMLGHADLRTTQIYLHVAIRQLRKIHRATHPAEVGAQAKGRSR
jgi:integrase/recombinase XerD